jgi:hypothetical protein
MDLSYAIDEHDHLIKVDDDFYGFAIRNRFAPKSRANSSPSSTPRQTVVTT